MLVCVTTSFSTTGYRFRSSSAHSGWYDIADKEGPLIQDNFPVWLLHNRTILGGERPDPASLGFPR